MTGPHLLPIYPNPFNPRANVPFELARDAHVRLVVFDLAGRRVATLLDEPRPAGRYTVVWQGRDHVGRAVASGSYYVRLDGDGVSELRKMTLLR